MFSIFTFSYLPPFHLIVPFSSFGCLHFIFMVILLQCSHARFILTPIAPSPLPLLHPISAASFACRCLFFLNCYFSHLLIFLALLIPFYPFLISSVFLYFCFQSNKLILISPQTLFLPFFPPIQRFLTLSICPFLI